MVLRYCTFVVTTQCKFFHNPTICATKFNIRLCYTYFKTSLILSLYTASNDGVQHVICYQLGMNKGTKARKEKERKKEKNKEKEKEINKMRAGIG